MKIKHDKLESEAIALRMVKLAFLASIPMGMGFIHYNPDQKVKDEQFKTLIDNKGFGGVSLFADYVQGRMMKLSLRWDNEGLEISKQPCRLDYQSWCSDYPTYRKLYDAAVAELMKEELENASRPNSK